MDIQNHRFDMTDPFAPVKQRFAQAETLMQEMPPAQRRALVAAMQTPISTRTPRSIDSLVTVASVPVPDWDGGSDALLRTGTAPVPVIRPRRRIRVKLPWWWLWFLAAERIDRRLRRWWQKHVQRQSHRQRQGPRRR